jgi:hypothetical protein
MMRLEPAQLAKEEDLIGVGNRGDFAEFDQILIEVVDRATVRLRLPAAIIAGHAAHAQVAACRTLAEWVAMFCEASFVRWIRRALVLM